MPYFGWAPAVFQGVGCFVTPGLCALCIIITMYDMLRNLCCAAPTLFQLRFTHADLACITCQPSVIIIQSLPPHPPQVKPLMPVLFIHLSMLPSQFRCPFFSPGSLVPPCLLSLPLQLLAIFTLYGSFMMALCFLPFGSLVSMCPLPESPPNTH